MKNYLSYLVNGYFFVVLLIAELLMLSTFIPVFSELISRFFPIFSNSYSPYIYQLVILVFSNSLVLFVINFLYILSLPIKKNILVARFRSIYAFLLPSIIVNNVLLLPFIMGFVLMNFFGSVIPFPVFIGLIVLAYIGMFFTYFKHIRFQIKNSISVSLFGVILLIASLGLGLFLLVAIEEMTPRTYGEFPLDDTKAEYVINYDGDYWVTYYVDRVKKGNTSITSSPVPLEQFRDKRVVVSGKFKPTIGPINPGDKKLCIRDKCEASKGNGIWYASPLEIESIRIDE